MRMLTAERGGAAVADVSSADVCAFDHDQFSLLYSETAGTVFRYAWSLVHDEALAEDVCAEVFLNAWRARSSYRGQGSPLSWLLSIAHNCALSQLRNSKIKEAELTPATPAVDHDHDPESNTIAKVDSRSLQEAIRRLTAEQQQVIFLRFFEGLRHEEIASILGRNANAIRALQFRALSQLRRHMEQANG